jgi:hypothetical protein
VTQPHQDPASRTAASPPPLPPDVEAELLVVELAELRPTYSVSDLLGRPVINEVGEKIGQLDDLLVADDRLAYAVLSVGGFLGVGAHQVVADFRNLLIDDDEIVLPGAAKETLKTMTVYDQPRVRSEHTPLRRARAGVKDSGEIVQTALGEPIPGVVADVSDADR